MIYQSSEFPQQLHDVSVGFAVPHHFHEACLHRRERFEITGESRGQRRSVTLLHTAHGHAVMDRLDHHGDAARIELGINCMDNLGGEVFLGLQAAREYFNNAGQLRQAYNAIIRQVGNMDMALERNHMVLAMGEKLDIPHQYNVVIAADICKRALQCLATVRLVA